MMPTRRTPAFASALLALGFAWLASPVTAQSLWLPRGHDHGVMIEVLRPDFHGIDEDRLTFVTFIGARLPASGAVSHVIEFSFARFGGDFPGINGPSNITSFTSGNFYAGLELGGRSALFGELGVHLPTGGGGEAGATGVASDLTRWEAFLNGMLSVQAALNARNVTSAGLSYRIRLSPVLAIPTTRGRSDPEIFAVYSGQLEYQRPAFRLGAAISARTLLTEDFGTFADRSDVQAEFHADLGSGRARPGLELKVPLGDLGDAVPRVVGVSLGLSY